MDKLGDSVCFVSMLEERNIRNCFYSCGAWKIIIESEELLTSHIAKADLCFVVDSGDTQLASVVYGITPEGPQFYPLVHKDTGAFWYGGGSLRQRFEKLFKESIWASRDFRLDEAFAMQRRQACYLSLMAGMKREITAEVKRLLSDFFFLSHRSIREWHVATRVEAKKLQELPARGQVLHMFGLLIQRLRRTL